MSRRRPERGDGGFTLVELLVAVMIEALIVGALAMAFTGILRSSTQVNQSLSRSSDARIAANYIVNDASNSSGPETSLTDTTSCADASPPVAGAQTAVVRFNSTITSSSGTTKPDIVIYYLVGTSLVRRECQNGALASDSAVASSVAGVLVACSPTADCSGAPTSITVTISETPSTSGPQYVYSLTGTFQKTIGAGAPGPPSSVILLGGGTCGATTGINISGSGKMRVYGDAYLNTKDNGTSCGAITLSGAPTYQAGGTFILNGGSCQAPAYLLPSCPDVTNYAIAHPDPYATVQAPVTTGRPSINANQQCQSPGSTAQPGVYSAQLVVSNSNSCQLQSGVYILQNGLSVSGAASLTSAAGGVLIYITGGSLSVGGSGAVNLSPMTTGQWAGLLVWQDKLNTSTISYSGAGTLSLNGALYAPSATLDVAGSAANPMVTALVIKGIIISGASVINVGTPSSPGLSIDPQSSVSWPLGKPFSQAITATGGDGDYIWSASNLPSPLMMDPDTGIISGTPNATGAKTVTVTLNDALGDDPDTASFTLTIDALPTVTSTSPTPRGQGAVNQNVTITGTGFVNGAALAASFSGTGITVNSTAYNNATSLTANISIAAGAATGVRDVTVTNGDTGAGPPGIGKFTVTAKPTVTSTSPASRGQGVTQNITITGTGFVNGVGTLASSFGTGITVNSTVYVNATSLTANITITAGATTGVHDVTVTNGDAGVNTGTGIFTVNAGPAVTSATPSSLARGATTQNVVIAGSGFVTGATVGFSGTGITLNTAVINNANQITANITVAGNATLSARNITVTNLDAGVGVGTGVFTVNALPTVTSTNPGTEWQGAATQDVTITGTGFQSGAGATFSGTGITVNSTTFNSATSVTANITVAAGATPGVRNVTVLNPDTGSATGTGIFKVGPVVTSISPASMKKSTVQNVTVSGNGFAAGATLSLTCSNAPAITNKVVVNSTTITATFTATSSKPTCSVVVTNPDGGTATLTNGFVVTN